MRSLSLIAVAAAAMLALPAQAQQAPANNAAPAAPAYSDPAASGATTGRMNRLIDAIEAKEFGLGPFSSVRDPINARALGSSKLNFIIIDMEHAPLDFETLRTFIANMRTIEGKFPVTPIVRIAINGREAAYNQWMFKQILDAGAMGIMVPQVNSPADAEAAVQAMRYPPFVDDAAPSPRGQRGFGGAPAAWGLAAPDYYKKADLWPLDPEGELLLIVQFETATSIDQFDEIMAVPGVGAAFLGPADLHADMGYGGQFGGVPEVADKIAEAGAKAKAAGAYLGILGGAGDWEKWRDQGFMFVSGSDNGLPAGLTDAVKALGR